MKLLITACCILVSMMAFSQTNLHQPEKLVQLKKSNTVLNKYVNFDVVKLMLGPGKSTSNFGNSFGTSVRWQFLVPFAFSKRFLKIAYGITFGSSRIKSRGTDILLKEDNQLVVTPDIDTKFSQIRTSSIGFITLRVIRLRRCTILVGPSFEYIRKSIVKTKSPGKEDQFFSLAGAYNKVIVPLNFQLSISKKQLAAFGFFARYDLNPFFKSQSFNSTRQFVFGVSGSFII